MDEWRVGGREGEREREGLIFSVYLCFVRVRVIACVRTYIRITITTHTAILHQSEKINTTYEQ